MSLNMGIRFLTTFVKSCRESFVMENISGDLVIDANGLLFFLMENCDKSIAGFNEIAQQFLAKLSECGIRPVLIFDGFQEGKEKERSRRRIQNMKEWAKSQNIELAHDSNVHDADWWTTGCGILNEDGLRFWSEFKHLFKTAYVCYGEADQEIVHYANEHHCPVLGNDSDFYIFEIEKGYIAFEDFKWESAHAGHGGIETKVFYLERFASSNKFPIQHRLLFPALMGNDRITQCCSYPVLIIRYAIILNKYRSFSEFLSMLRENDQSSEAPELKQMCVHVDYQTLVRNCEMAEEFYEGCDSASSCVPLVFKKLPSWALKQFQAGRFHTTVIEVLATGWCFPFLRDEDFCRDSSHAVSNEIRAHTYGILIGQDKKVMENIRLSRQLVINDVPIRTKVVYPTMSLAKIEQFTMEDRKRVLCRIMSCQPHCLTYLPSKQHLIAVATQFWYRKTNPDDQLTRALIACFLYCQSGQSVYKLKQIPSSYRDYLKILHALACWRQVYYDVRILNGVLMEPFECISSIKFFDGDVVQYFSKIPHQRFITKELGIKVMEDFEKLLSFVMDKTITNSFKIEATMPKLVTTVHCTDCFAILDIDEDDGDDDREVEEEEEEWKWRSRIKRRTKRREGRGEGGGGGGSMMMKKRRRRKRRREGRGGGREREEEEEVEEWKWRSKRRTKRREGRGEGGGGGGSMMMKRRRRKRRREGRGGGREREEEEEEEEEVEEWKWRSRRRTKRREGRGEGGGGGGSMMMKKRRRRKRRREGRGGGREREEEEEEEEVEVEEVVEEEVEVEEVVEEEVEVEEEEEEEVEVEEVVVEES